MSAIVVGYDGSEGSRASLDRAIDLAQGLGDTVTVVFAFGVRGAPGGEMGAAEDAAEERGERVMQLVADQAAAKSFEVERKLVDAHPDEALVEETKKGDVRMIVVGNQGAPHPLAGALLGAVPFKLVHASPVPVLVVPPS